MNQPASSAADEGRGRIAELDGLRGLAIGLVLVWHYFVLLVHPPAGSGLAALKGWLGLTWSGVDLFFVLSGYLLGGILMDHRASPQFYQAFYWRRACRILPIYFVLLMVAAIGLSAGWGNAGGWREHLLGRTMPFGSYVTFTQNFFMAQARDFGGAALGATWSLAVEEQFYLFLPLLIRFVPPVSLPGALLLLIFGAPACRLAIWVTMDPTGAAGLVLMPARADSLLLGVLAAFLVRQTEFTSRLAGQRRLFESAWLVLGAGLLLLARFGGQIPGVLAHVLGHSLLAAFYALLILLAPTGFPGMLLRGRVLAGLGTISYGVYLLHMPVLGLAHGLFRKQLPQIGARTDVLVTAGALVFTIGLATLSWQWLEKPIVRLGRRHRY